jgi:hypothetical protein
MPWHDVKRQFLQTPAGRREDETEIEREMERQNGREIEKGQNNRR